MRKLSKTGETLEDYNYQNEEIAGLILNEIADLQFKGMSVSPFITNFRIVRYRMSLLMGFMGFIGFIQEKRAKYFIIYGISTYIYFTLYL